MILREFISTLVSSLNPNAYSGLALRESRGIIKYFFAIILLFSFLNFLLFTPQIVDFYSGFNENLAKINSINASFITEATERIVLLENPLIVIDSDANESSGEFLLVTSDTIYKKGLFGYDEVKTENLDIAGFIKSSRIKIFFLMILSLPTVFLFYFSFAIIKYFLLASFFSFLAFSIVTLINYGVDTRQILSASIFTLTPYLGIKLLLVFNGNFKVWIPLLVYIVWYGIVIMLMVDSRVSFMSDASRTVRKMNKSKSSSLDVDVGAADMAKINKLVNKRK